MNDIIDDQEEAENLKYRARAGRLNPDDFEEDFDSRGGKSKFRNSRDYGDDFRRLDERYNIGRDYGSNRGGYGGGNRGGRTSFGYRSQNHEQYEQYGDRRGYNEYNRGGYNSNRGGYNNSNRGRGGKFYYKHMNAARGEEYTPGGDRYNSRHDAVKTYMFPPKNQEFPFKHADDDLQDLDEAAAIEDSAKAKPDTRGQLPFVVNEENKFEILNRVMCPYQHVIYENQLRRKYNGVRLVLKEMGQKLRHTSPIVVDGIGLPCPLDLVKRAPKVIEYRNKDEFSLWPGVDGNRKTVGFFVGEPSRYSNAVCVEPDKLIITKPSHRRLASLFQDYLRNVSPYDVCTNFADADGHWRRFIVRSNEEGEHMIICQMHPQHLTADQLAAEKQRLIDFWKPLQEEFNIKSAYLQPCPGTRMSNEEAPYQLLFGEETIVETLCDKKFVISPESFFQVNTPAAEVLYNTVFQELAPDPTLTVIDLCCGTGTMSTIIAPFVKRVIGIEQSAQAIGDAKKNAALNNVRNISFICGKAEDEIVKMLDDFRNDHVVLIANPSRAGLSPAVISAIREMQQIEKLIYVSCKPNGPALKNFVHLGLKESTRNDRIKGAPFVPVNAIPVDLFPQTSHVELVLTFERFMM